MLSHPSPLPPPAHRAALVADLRQRPGFAQVARQVASDLAESYRGNRLLNRLLNDRGRIALALLMLDMHYSGLGDIDDPGLTVGRLKAEASRLGICSPGRAGAVLATFRLLGLVGRAPESGAASDRRFNRLAVTDKLLDIHRQRWRKLFSAMATLMPEGRQALEGIGQPTFETAFVAALLEPFRNGWRMVDDVPALRAFVDRNGGLAIALSMMAPAEDGAPRAIAHLASQFGVSRSHVLAILQDAEKDGLVRRPDPRGGVLAAPSLIEALETTVAIILLMQAGAVRHACLALTAASTAR